VLVLHYDFPSPAAAAATLRLQTIADAGGAVAFSGLDVLGLAVTIPPTLDQLAEYERARAQAAAHGVELARPTGWPPTFDAHLVGDRAEAAGLGAAWRLACLRAFWVRGADLSSHDALRTLASDVGLDAATVDEVLGDVRARARRRQQDAASRRRGVGGVPVLELDGTLLGADLPDAELRALANL
jgi:predicted DsbA family dithiol-disulfide isomerase